MARDGHQQGTPRPVRSRTAVYVYRGIGVAAVGVATAGVFLPLLPTTVFLLVALWAFARGSPEWADRIRANRRFGPYIRAWEEKRAIPLRAKALALGMMGVSWTVLAVTSHSVLLVTVVGLLLMAVAGYIVSRPSA
jgi:uncharacterized membrane protein YbaN (DUF454 family)